MNTIQAIPAIASKPRPRRITSNVPPRTITEDDGRIVHLRPYQEHDFEDLVSMYDDFDPAHLAQGTPPLGEDVIRAWLRDVPGGVNVVAVCDDELVGHVMFVPDGTRRHELAIFVDQDYQPRGIGTELIAAGTVKRAAREATTSGCR
ncbi:MAG: N-acetyltransferase family protein [Natronomonas sp.]